MNQAWRHTRTWTFWWTRSIIFSPLPPFTPLPLLVNGTPFTPLPHSERWGCAVRRLSASSRRWFAPFPHGERACQVGLFRDSLWPGYSSPPSPHPSRLRRAGTRFLWPPRSISARSPDATREPDAARSSRVCQVLRRRVGRDDGAAATAGGADAVFGRGLDAADGATASAGCSRAADGPTEATRTADPACWGRAVFASLFRSGRSPGSRTRATRGARAGSAVPLLRNHRAHLTIAT